MGELEYLVALGSNLGPRRVHLAAALGRIAAVRSRAVIACSRWIATQADPPCLRPFLNGVAWVRTREDPESFMERLLEIEILQGRDRSTPDRTLDLDLIAARSGGKAIVMESPLVILPHPRAAGRTFVLRPAAEIAPEWRLVSSGPTVRELLTDLVAADKGSHVIRVQGQPHA